MASIVSKRKGNKTYYYVVTSARVNGQPRITSQTCLGTGRTSRRPGPPTERSGAPGR